MTHYIYQADSGVTAPQPSCFVLVRVLLPPMCPCMIPPIRWGPSRVKKEEEKHNNRASSWMITLNYSLGYLKSWINQPPSPLILPQQKPPFITRSNRASLRLSIKSPFQTFLSILTEVLLLCWKNVINKCLIFGWECLLSASMHVIHEWLSLTLRSLWHRVLYQHLMMLML